MEVRLWHEFARYVSLIAAKPTEGRSLFAPAFLCEHSRKTKIGVRPAIFCDSNRARLREKSASRLMASPLRCAASL
jgi:hypothetical protein